MTKAILLFFLVYSHLTFAQKAEVVKFDRLRSLVEGKSSHIQVINFWATWCAPCVKELPFFEALNKKNDPFVKVTLISLDYADKVNKVNDFIKRKDIKTQVLLLDEIDYNAWIDKVDKQWGGAIPATLVINQKTGQRKFVEKELRDGELEQIIADLKKQN